MVRAIITWILTFYISAEGMVKKTKNILEIARPNGCANRTIQSSIGRRKRTLQRQRDYQTYPRATIQKENNIGVYPNLSCWTADRLKWSMKNGSASICGRQSWNEKKRQTDFRSYVSEHIILANHTVPSSKRDKKIVKHLRDIGKLHIGQSLEIKPIKIYFSTKTKEEHIPDS